MTTRNAFQEELERRKAALLASDEANPDPEGRVITRAPNLPDEWHEKPRQLGHHCPECEKDVNVTIADEASGQPDANGLTPLKKVARCVICNGKVRTVTPATVKLILSNPNGNERRSGPSLPPNIVPTSSAEIATLIRDEIARAFAAESVAKTEDAALAAFEGPPVTLVRPKRPRTLMQEAKKRLAEVKRAIAANQRELAKLQREMAELETLTGTHPPAKSASVARIGVAK